MNPVQTFLQLSVHLTGFSETELLGSGQAQPFLDEITSIAGERAAGQLLGVAGRILEQGGDPNQAIQVEIMKDPYLGPLARNVIVMWYLGQWDQLPRAWRDAYGANPSDITHIVSDAAYRSGLVWVAIGSHPSGAKAPGYASWAQPPAASPAPPTGPVASSSSRP